MQKSIITRALIVLLVVVVCALAVNPPREKLRLGKDLAGGVSLVYTVQVDDEQNPGEVIARTIDVLKQRVDPNGLFEISMVAQGRDRIQITMPSPSKEVKDLRRAFDEEVAKLGKSALTESRLERDIRLPGAGRSAAFEAMAAGSAKRAELLATAGTTYDDWMAKQAAYDAADAASKPALVEPVASANIAYETARTAVLRTVLDSTEVMEVVNAATKRRQIIDGAKLIEIPSPREVAEKELLESHPDSLADIERVLATYESYASKRRTLDDPNDLIKLMKGAGVLTFRIAVNPGEYPEEAKLRDQLKERGPRNVESSDARWFRINQIEGWVDNKAEADALFAGPERAAAYFTQRGYVGESYQGDYYLLLWSIPGKQLVPVEGDKWAVSTARQGQDQLGRPSIDFAMDSRGGVLLGAMTEKNVGNKMAVLLDDQVYTAPNLQNAISAQGTITGKFDAADIEYVVRVLGGGSLQARVSPVPISVNTQTPDLGLENLRTGLKAGVFSLIMCATFLMAYYFYCGIIATFALAINLLLLVGAMSLNMAAFTLPGIAGVILAIAMAVDANVLVFERMREEIVGGADLRKAVRLGYEKAMSAIVDGNLTNLIVCFVLGLPFIGTPEVRGFAITMGIGVVTTLFSQLVITKLIFDVGTENFRWRKTTMLPLAVPAVQRLLTLNVNWLRYRYVFFAVFAGLIALSTAVIISRGSEMLGTEFRGGTAITIQTKTDANGQPVMLERAEVVSRVRAIADTNPGLADMRNADVVVVNADATGMRSGTFTVKTLGKDTKAISDSISRAFEDVMADRAPIEFRGSDAVDAVRAPVYPITTARLGAVIDKPAVMNQVPDFVGGVAIVLEGIRPPVSAAQIRDRLQSVRGTTPFSDTVGRTSDVLVIEGTEDAATTAVVLVRDPEVSFFGNEAWNAVVRDREWAIAVDSLTKQTTFLNVQSFSGEISRSFTGQAIASILFSTLLITIYVWVRFNSIRFSIAAIVPTLIDCYIVLGLIALAETLYDGAPGFARSLGLLPFKIDLTTVASILTILGYSINDKIVVLDRIRENRGKLKVVTADIINTSINQTFSRTLMTGTTTILSTLILYLVGGEAVRAFAFTLGLGVVIGTASSVALGAPLVWSREAELDAEDADATPVAA